MPGFTIRSQLYYSHITTHVQVNYLFETMQTRKWTVSEDYPIAVLRSTVNSQTLA